MSARTMYVAFPTPASALLRGYGARELLTEIRGRSPVYATRTRAWCCQPHTARDAIAVAEARNWHVQVVPEEHLLRLAGIEVAEERGQLW